MGVESQWVSVSDTLPSIYQQVLVSSEYDDGSPAIFIEFYNGDKKGFLGINGRKDKYVTHWMPMPDPPVTQK